MDPSTIAQTLPQGAISPVIRFRIAAVATIAALVALFAVSAHSQVAGAPSAASPQAFAAEARETSPFAAMSESFPDSAVDSAPSSRIDFSSSNEAPAFPMPAQTASGAKNTSTAPVARIHQKYIPAGTVGQPLTARDKFFVGVHDLYSPFSILGSVTSALYSHVTNGEPNYGTNLGAFGQQLGATVIRDSNEGFFADSLLDPLFHEDPRYFVEGPSYGFVHRVLYAGTRPIITRNDSGKNTLNAALLVGYAGASAISYSYYPQVNKNFRDTASTFGGSLGGAAVGFLVSEFSDQVLQALHLEKKP